jgi:hypothetical protein
MDRFVSHYCTTKAHFLRVGEREVDDGDPAEDPPGRLSMRRLPSRVHL